MRVFWENTALILVICGISKWDLEIIDVVDLRGIDHISAAVL